MSDREAPELAALLLDASEVLEAALDAPSVTGRTLFVDDRQGVATAVARWPGCATAPLVDRTARAS